MFTGLLGTFFFVSVLLTTQAVSVVWVGTESGWNNFVPLLTSAGNQSSLGWSLLQTDSLHDSCRPGDYFGCPLKPSPRSGHPLLPRRCSCVGALYHMQLWFPEAGTIAVGVKSSRRETLYPFFWLSGCGNNRPHELEFSQESHAGRKKRLKPSVRQKNLFHPSFSHTHKGTQTQGHWQGHRLEHKYRHGYTHNK